MDKITIAKNNVTVELPRVRAITVGAVEESREAVMWGGKAIKEVRGIRKTIEASYDWLPVGTINDLLSLLRQGGFFTVSYPDPELGDASGQFSVKYPSTKVFRFKNGVPRWHDVTLIMTAQDLTLPE